jgi:hypothetical protein
MGGYQHSWSSSHLIWCYITGSLVKDLEGGSGGGLDQGTILEFFWRDWVKAQETTAMTASNMADVWNGVSPEYSSTTLPLYQPAWCQVGEILGKYNYTWLFKCSDFLSASSNKLFRSNMDI